MSELAVQLKNVNKSYQLGKGNFVHALKKINLGIKKGEFIAIMGPSGSGKSTLLNLIGLLDRPDSGEIYFGQRQVSRVRLNRLYRLRRDYVGFIFQTFNLLPRLSAQKNVILPLVYSGKNRGKRKSRANEILAKVNLTERSRHKPSQLSGGERQRVAIARALANDPAVILADEPTGNLDSQSGRETMEILKELNQKGKTIIVVTHDQIIAQQADRIVKLIDGEIKIN